MVVGFGDILVLFLVVKIYFLLGVGSCIVDFKGFFVVVRS